MIVISAHLLTCPATFSSLHSGYGTVGAALLLAVFVCLLYYRLLFTNRVLASGDILLYFYPYRDYAAALLRAGQPPSLESIHLSGRAISGQSPGRCSLSPALALKLAAGYKADLLERSHPYVAAWHGRLSAFAQVG